MIRLSILDQSPVPEGGTPAEALRATVELARAAEGLGYTRYWLAEHHGSPSFAGTAPEITTAAVLAATTTLRAGPGGILLPRYSPAKVAEVVRVLTALYPERVDLGVGRAGGPAHDFPQKLAVLLGLLGEQAPPLWLLGASVGSAALAAGLDTAYCFAHFLNPSPGVAALAEYNNRSSQPRAAVAVRVLLSDTAAKADDLARSLLLWRSRKDLGEDGPIPALESTRRHDWSDAELERAQANSAALIHGTPEQVRPVLAELANEHGVAELVVNTVTHDPADRLRSYQLLAEVMADTNLVALQATAGG